MAIDTRGSYTAHAALSVSGTYADGTDWTLTIKDLDEVPDGTAVDAAIAANRPIMFPVFWQNTSSAAIPTTSVGTGDAVIPVMFLCCVDKPRVWFQNKNPRTGEMDTICDIGPKAMDVHNAYLTALFGDPDLGGTLDAHFDVAIEVGAFPWADGMYSALLVRMTWKYLVG